MKPSEYTADELLPLGGLQHFHFCRRQWALIYVERAWQDNALTVDGKLFHRKVDDPTFTEVRGGVITSRAMPIASYRLGLSGVCDVIEFTPSPDGVNLRGREGRYLPTPVEYKRGMENQDACDEVQLCAQAMCLEEMMAVSIPQGFLYYGEPRRRVSVDLNQELRDLVTRMAAEMHSYFSRGYTPRVKTSRACQSCSLKDLCLPVLMSKVLSASKYIRLHIEEDGD